MLRIARHLSSTAGGEAALRGSILAAALKHVNVHGWSTHALAAGAVDVGLSPSSHALVSGGGHDLIAHFQHSADEQLRVRLGELGEHEAGSNVSHRLAVAMKLRLALVAPYASTWAQALALQALPTQVPATVKRAAMLAELLDDYAHSTQVPYSAAAPAEPLSPFAGGSLVPSPSCARRAAIAGAYGLAELHLVAGGGGATDAVDPSGEELAANYQHVDELCAGLERGALSLNWIENELAHAAVHSRLVLGVLSALGGRR